MIYGRDKLSHPLGGMILCKLSIMNQVKENLTRGFTDSGQNSRYFINHFKYMIPSFEGVFFLCFNEHSKGLFIWRVGSYGLNVLRVFMKIRKAQICARLNYQPSNGGISPRGNSLWLFRESRTLFIEAVKYFESKKNNR